MRHLLLIMRKKKTEATLNIAYFEKTMSPETLITHYEEKKTEATLNISYFEKIMSH